MYVHIVNRAMLENGFILFVVYSYKQLILHFVFRKKICRAGDVCSDNKIITKLPTRVDKIFRSWSEISDFDGS